MSESRPTVVLFVHGPPNVGGDSVVLLRTIRHLDRERFTALAVAPPGSEAWSRLGELADEGLVRRFPLPMGVVSHLERDLPSQAGQRRSKATQALLLGRSAAALLYLVAREGVDVIYTMDRSRAVMVAAVAARALRRGLVWHGHCPWTSWGSVVRFADRAVLITDFVRREYERNGVPASKMRVVHNGIDTSHYGTVGDGARARQRLGLAAGVPLVLMPGRLSRLKGQLELVEAIPAIRERVPQAQFVIAGGDSSELEDLQDTETDGGKSMLAVLRRRAGELGVAEGTHFLRPSDEELADLFAAADVVTVPSWSEPFGLVVAEAMASGAPVVGAAAGGIPEIIVHGETGLLVPPREVAPLATAVADLLGDGERRRRMGAAAQQRAREHFSIERYTREVGEVLAEVAAARSRKRSPSGAGRPAYAEPSRPAA